MTANARVGRLALPALFMTALLAADPATSTDRPWKTVAASGSVESRPIAGNDRGWYSVERGDSLEPDSIVRTGRRGQATLTRSSSVVILDHDSALEIEGAGSSIVQTSGSALYDVDRRDPSDLRIATPNLFAGARGASFLVTVTDRYSTVTVERGPVRVTDRNTGEVAELSGGETAVYEAPRNR